MKIKEKMKVNGEKKNIIPIKLEQNKGITLIALVVTIIVLLILAGVSIQMLVGEGGILTNAREAARKTNQADAKERIELEIAETMLEYHDLTAEGLNKNLAAHIPGLTHEGRSLTENPINELPAIVELDGYVFQIDENGKVTAIDGIALSKSNLELQILTHNGSTEYGKETLTATLIGITGNITWSTEGQDVIDVSPTEGASATITAKKAGTAKVTATCSGRTAECNVTVKEVEAVTSITLDPTTKTINEGDELKITATVEGTEDLTWDWEKTSGETSLTITPSGDGKKICTVVAQGAGVAKVKAKSSQTEAMCTITVESPYIDNSYVQYDVGYTDVYTGTEYTKNTGWRAITNLSSYEEAGEYRGKVDIISTGIPAKLYYYYRDVKNFEIENELSNVTKGKWAGNQEQREEFATEYFGDSSNKDNYNVYAAAGLLNNFKNIVFKVTGTGNAFADSSTYNYGGFINIVTDGKVAVASEEPTGEELFEANIASGKIDGIRSVHLGDIKGSNTKDTETGTITSDSDKRPGLFTLQNYTPDKHTTGYYWLASAYTSNINSGVCLVNYDGSIYNSDHPAEGVRPVVSISNVHMKLRGHVWEIIDN